jgi:hypothetical protein
VVRRYLSTRTYQISLSAQKVCASGANFATETKLQNGYSFGTPVDVTGDFRTFQKRKNGGFISLGLDLDLSRKIFGNVSGVGTAAPASTQGN